MAIFGAQGIRDAMKRTYFKQVEVARAQTLPSGASLHQIGLYGALASRYIAGAQQPFELMVWAELFPFMHLDADMALDALAEYIVFKEMPQKAERQWLEQVVQHGIGLWDQESRDSHLMLARARNFAWANLVI